MSNSLCRPRRRLSKGSTPSLRLRISHALLEILHYQESCEMLILSGATIAKIFESDDRTLNLRRWKGEQVAFQHRRHVAADKFAPRSLHGLAQCE